MVTARLNVTPQKARGRSGPRVSQLTAAPCVCYGAVRDGGKRRFLEASAAALRLPHSAQPLGAME